MILIKFGLQRVRARTNATSSKLAKEANVLVQFVPKKKLDRMVEGNHQGVVAQVAAYQYAEIDDLFAAAEKKNEVLFFIAR